METTNDKIFIQIASYRDPLLTSTVEDCIAKSKYPDNLVFCVAWQHGEENIDEIARLENVKIIDIPYEKSMGACWARNQIQQRYNNEEYTLQLDSHHRFIQNWDEQLINMFKQLKSLGHEKPLITSYIPSFDPNNDPAGRVMVPWKMNFDRFIPEGAVFFLPAAIEDWKSRDKPVPARFYSAHFAFASGSFVKEVPHDPNYYFHGEEISIAVRAFTHGYDLFHPHKILAWHEYTRKGRTKHWDDRKEWWKWNSECHLRNRKLFSMDGEKYESIDWGPYGFGSVRTLRDYEKYSGIHFGKRAVQVNTSQHKYPPNDCSLYKNDVDWENSFQSIFKHCIDLQMNKFTEDDYDFWCVAFERSDGTQLYRRDVDEKEAAQLLNASRDPKGDHYIKLWREFVTSEKPHHWVVWPHSKSAGWGEKIVGNL